MSNDEDRADDHAIYFHDPASFAGRIERTKVSTPDVHAVSGLLISPLGGYDSRYSIISKTQNMSEHEHPHVHQSHEAIIKRLKRADGHLRGIITMIEEGRECVDIAQQLHAVEKAVCQAKRTLIQDHIDHCLEDTVSALNNLSLIHI